MVVNRAGFHADCGVDFERIWWRRVGNKQTDWCDAIAQILDLAKRRETTALASVPQSPQQAVAARTQQVITNLTALCGYYEALESLGVSNGPAPELRAACERLIGVSRRLLVVGLENDLKEIAAARQRAQRARRISCDPNGPATPIVTLVTQTLRACPDLTFTTAEIADSLLADGWKPVGDARDKVRSALRELSSSKYCVKIGRDRYQWNERQPTLSTPSS
ncbi:hypothetical protein ACIP5Y_21805 [Nocardia sp. NPDC088792]|uniref:hypothetical protein n=1 Tax=Nocardia sp. NPDC088792 TaxID=3364332 RepID=UPI00381F6F97